MEISVQIVEYVWTWPVGIMRSKTRIFKEPIFDVNKLPIWDFAVAREEVVQGKYSDVTIKPVRIYPDPFRGKNDIIVLCETYEDGNLQIPSKNNTRHQLKHAMERKEEHEIWTAIEQEYVFFHAKTKIPYLWNDAKNPGPGDLNHFYCGVGADSCFGREIVEEHMNVCLKMKIEFGGINAEVMASQWEFQIGPGEPLKISDDLLMARYVLERIAEKYKVTVSYHPKSNGDEWSGSGGHVNFSTKKMREEKGLEEIIKGIKKLEVTHNSDILAYGADNNLRLNDNFGTTSLNKFKWGIGDRFTSVRINKHVAEQEKGYFEDRRPASNLDPYIVLSKIVNSVVN